MTTSRPRRWAAILAVAAVGLAGCGSDGAAGGDRWPLTGLPAADGVADGPVLAVKIDNTASASPQLGLDRADLVVEEAVEGRVTRLMAMFHSQLDEAGTAGPVRSIRDSDIGIVLPTEGVLVASGGAPGPLERLEDAGVQTAFEGSTGMSRAPDRSPPYDLVVDLETLSGSLQAADAPGDYLAWGDAAVEEGQQSGEPVTAIDLVFSQAQTTSFVLDGDVWRRSAETAAGGGFAADTVLALRVELVDAGYVDPGGNTVERTLTTGSGDGVLVSGSTAQPVRWSKSEEDDPWELTDADGNEVLVPAGRTWIGLVPVEGDVVTE